MKQKIKLVIQFIANPHFLLCFGIAWIITNGWSYILLALGSVLQCGWMIAVSTAYLTFLWFPFTPEKIATFSIAIGLLRILFPNDTKTLAVLRSFYEKAVAAFRNHRILRQEKKQQRKAARQLRRCRL